MADIETVSASIAKVLDVQSEHRNGGPKKSFWAKLFGR